MKRPKFAVHNRGTTSQPKKLSALAEEIAQRQNAVVASLQQQKKSNVFVDQRIGESHSKQEMLSSDAKNLARLVRERARQSKRNSKFMLMDNDEEHVLTHKGQSIKDMSDVDHVILSDDDEDDNGNLDAYDTAMHFGGKGLSDSKIDSVYGGTNTRIATAYEQKKQDLDDMIMRRKAMKLDRIKSKEEQVDKFEEMDQSFAELSSLLQFRDKEQEIRHRIQLKRNGEVSNEDLEYEDWDREMKQYLHVERKVAATDRTKTPEEIAKEEADRLHLLETRRIARMSGDIDENDDLSDDGNVTRNKKRKLLVQRQNANDNAEALDNDSDIENDDQHTTTRFTSEGLVYVNKEGVIIGKVGENNDPNSSDDDSRADHDEHDPTVCVRYGVGDKVLGNYRASEQYDGHESWYVGVITAVVVTDDDNTKAYNIEYDDGDFEENVEPRNIRPFDAATEIPSNTKPDDGEVASRRKRQKIMEHARYVSFTLFLDGPFMSQRCGVG
jgi:nucleolar protein 14